MWAGYTALTTTPNTGGSFLAHMTKQDEGTAERGSATFSTFSKGGLHSTIQDGENEEDPPGRQGTGITSLLPKGWNPVHSIS